MPGGQQHYRRRGYRYPYPYPVGFASDYSVVVEKPEGSCGCEAGGELTQKIKQNPLVFVVGALFVGYLLAKKK